MTPYQQLRALENSQPDLPLDVLVPKGGQYFRDSKKLMQWLSSQI